MPAAPEEIARLLSAWNAGNRGALDALMPLVYDELHSAAAGLMRNERPAHTLSATAVIHAAYLKLLRANGICENQAHLVNIVARYMRQVLVDHARKRKTGKRGLNGDLPPDAPRCVKPQADMVVVVDEALSRLEKVDAEMARLVELRYFGGFTLEETATSLGFSLAKTKLEWNAAKAYLSHQLNGGHRGNVP